MGSPSHRRVPAVLAALLLTVTGGAAAAPASAPMPLGRAAAGPDAKVTYAAPAPLRVLRRFEQPAGPYGPGHRGVDLAAVEGDAVRAAADGTVTFAGAVAGRGVVVVRHPDGVRTEYEPVRPAVGAGAVVSRGQLLGTLTGRHASCLPATCLHWGARRGTGYLDPLSLLQPLGPVRLLPWRPSGTPALGRARLPATAAGHGCRPRLPATAQARGWACR